MRHGPWYARCASVGAIPRIAPRLPTPGLLASVLAEQLLMATLPAVLAPRTPEGLGDIRAEVDQAIATLDSNGWLDDPRGFHRYPAPPERPMVETAALWGLRYEKLTFDSGYDPPPGFDRAEERWAAPPNRTAHAYVLRHREAGRPWLVLQHGYSGGQPVDCLVVMRGRHFHRDLGFNVIMPMAPYHAERKVLGRSGAGMMSSDYVRNLHAYAQAAWDMRRCMSWAESEGASSFALYGVSMGGYLVSLVAGIDDRVGSVIAGVPAVDTAAAIRRRTPDRQWPDLEANGLFGECLDLIHRPVNPLSFTPLVAPDRRYIYAAIADQVVTADDAYRLWQHWHQPSVLWFRGTHVSALAGREVRRFVDETLVAHTREPERSSR